MKIQNQFLAFVLTLGFYQIPALASSVAELTDRADNAARVLEKLDGEPTHSIPRGLLADAQCIATIPGLLRAGFIFGAEFGQGLVVCRTPDGAWSNPGFIRITAGSWGLQIGVASVDLVLVFVRANAPAYFTTGNFALSGDVSAVAGPIGRDAQMGVDYKITSGVYSYSQSSGLFAGLTLQGAMLEPDKDADKVIYGDGVSVVDMMKTASTGAPAQVSAYLNIVQHLVP